jgi:hypothetical protein
MAGWEVGLQRGDISRDDRVVLFNCGNGLKYPMPPADRVLATCPSTGIRRLAARSAPRGVRSRQQ